MSKTLIRFKVKLLLPEMEPARPRADQRAKADSWTFLILPKTASAKLPSRGMTAIEGTINGVLFQAVLEPDGEKSHWLKVDRKLREAAGADAGDVVTLEIAPTAEDPEPDGAGRSEKSSRGRRPEGAGVMVGHHAQSRAEIGSTGSPPPSSQRRARAGSKMPARCSRPESDAFAASTGPGFTTKA